LDPSLYGGPRDLTRRLSDALRHQPGSRIDNGRAARKGSPSSFGEPRAARPRAWSDPISRWQKLQGLRGAFSPASRYPPQRGPCHGNHSRKVSRPAAAEEGVCESGYAHAGWIAAGDAGLVRLQGWSRSGEHREGTSQSAQLEERRARGACDRRSRQPVPLRSDPWPRPARHGRRRGRAHRFAREEIPRAGQVSVCGARRSPPDVRDRADIRIRNGLNGARYSGLILPSTITFFHFSYSARVKAVACSGVVPRGVIPILAKAAFSSGCCSTLLISPLSFASTAGGSPAG